MSKERKEGPGRRDGEAGAGRERESNRILERAENATRMGAEHSHWEEYLGTNGCFWPRQRGARSADRLTFVVRNPHEG